jgi:exopolyphosphatase/guanosine-5'-triphosphate,3'-diphosphate pyrophosphatase
MMTERIGIIDLGSNSSRFVIYEIRTNGAYQPIFEMKQTVRLAQYMDDEKRITDEGIQRAIACVKLFARVGQLYGVTHWIPVTTAAVRQAANKDLILQALEIETRLTFRVLDGFEEGRYSYLGVINTIDVQDALLFDIGGASIELMYVRGRQLEQVISLPYGAVNLTSQFQKVSEQMQGETIYRFMKEQFSNIDWLNQIHVSNLIGMGGSAKTLAKMDRNKKGLGFKRIHGYEVSQKSLHEYFQRINALSIDQRKKMKGVSKQRAEVLPAGLATMHALSEKFPVGKIMISRSGLREGLFFEYLFRFKQSPVVESVLDHSVFNFQKLFHVNVELASQVTRTSLFLFDSLKPIHALGEYERKLLQVFSQIESCGYYINPDSWAKHSSYLVLSSHLNGLSHEDLVHLSLLLKGEVNRNLKKVLMIHELAKIMTLHLSLESQQQLFCKIDGEDIYIGSVPGINHTIQHSADVQIKDPFRKVFGKKLHFVEG